MVEDDDDHLLNDVDHHLLVLVLLVELLVHLESLGDQAHQVPVSHVTGHIVQHPALAVVLRVTVGIAVVSENEISFKKNILLVVTI